jgi:alkylation response protein AidB-like acyl-CoA dehydrogenase|tara:strand:+ start:308 stop:1450 length:1143 start_codon:yes stop_codon:yes gene_type:complete
MKLDLTDDQQLFQETVRRFVETEVPISTVRGLIGDADGFDRGWWREAAALGWTSLLVPEALGGGSISGTGPVDLAIVAEEIGRGVAPGPLVPVNVVAETIARSGSAEQQGGLEGVLAGETILAWCFNELGGNWTPEGVSLQATEAADGFTLNGVKTAVEAGGQADFLLVTATTGTDLTQFLIPADLPGITITAQSSLDLARRFAEVRFDNVGVDASAVVGTVGGAQADVERQCIVATMLQCAETTGAVARVFEFTVEYAFDRHSFGRPLASYQALKHRFADMKLWLEASHATADGAGLAVAIDVDAARTVSVAKAYIGDKSVDIIQDCVQLHGGIGVTWEHDIHLYLRRATVNRGLFGTPNDHRERLAALVGIKRKDETT